MSLPWRWYIDLFFLSLFIPSLVFILTRLYIRREAELVRHRRPLLHIFNGVVVSTVVIVMFIQGMLLLSGRSFPCALMLVANSFCVPCAMVPAVIGTLNLVYSYDPSLKTKRNQWVTHMPVVRKVILALSVVFSGVLLAL